MGDSITWQNLYTCFVESYYLRSYPERALVFHNRGLRGDTAAAALTRIERDIVPLGPAVVFVHFGMNDGGYRDYRPGLLRSYVRNLKGLVGEIKRQTGAQVILMTPTPVAQVEGRLADYNRMLSAMALAVVELGKKLDVPVVDLFSYFVEQMPIAAELEPAVVLMSDAIHPNAAGHLLLAKHLLTQLDPRPRAREQIVEAAHWRRGAAPIDTVLPIWLPPKARGALRLFPRKNHFGGPTIVAQGLTGDTTLELSGRAVMTLSPGQLARGVSLAQREPWVSQAQAHYRLLQKKWALTYYLWDPKELGRDALSQVGAGAVPAMSKRQALRELGKTKRDLAEVSPKRLQIRLLAPRD